VGFGQLQFGGFGHRAPGCEREIDHDGPVVVVVLGNLRYKGRRLALNND